MLLLLHRRPERAWLPAELSAELKTTPDSVAGRLSALARDGLVEGDDERFRFGAGPGAAAVADVASCYATHRVAVIETIFSGDRQPDALRSFADAFRVRRDPG